MANSTRLEGRLLAVLNQRVNRRRVTRALALAALALGMCVVFPVAMLRAASENIPSIAEQTTDKQKNTNDDTSESAAKPPRTESADAGNNEVNRVKVRHAENELQRATELRRQNLLPETEFDKARTELEIARAELSGRQDEVVRIKLRNAESELARLDELQKASLVSKDEVDQVRYKVALLRAEMRGDAAEADRVRFGQAEDALKRATQLRQQNLIAETEYNAARQQSELRQAELRQKEIDGSATASSVDDMGRLLRAGDEARAKAEDVELKLREAGAGDRLLVFKEAHTERDKQLATARNQRERLMAYERYAKGLRDLEHRLVKEIEMGQQPVGIDHIARYEIFLAELDLLRAKNRASGTAAPPAGQILVEARVIEAPAKARIPDDPSSITTGKGINVLSSPRILTGIGQEAEIFIGQEQPANAAPGPTEFVRTGIIMSVTPRLKEDRIAYTVRLTLSNLVHSEAKGAQTINETSARELHVSGTVKEGEGTWFHLTEQRNGKKIAVWLKFNRQG